MGYYERVVKDQDFRLDLQAARAWRVHPTVFLRLRTVEGPWTDQDTALARALAHYEAQCCSRGHFLPVTSAQGIERRLRTTNTGICHQCASVDMAAESKADHPHPGALLFSTVINEPVPLEP